jgi:pantoate--beta-alanine ligase
MNSHQPAAAKILRSAEDLRAEMKTWRGQGLSIGFVPTMGALHQGHLSLLRAATQRHDRVVASIFVNPKQFAPAEDFERYPRDEAKDAGLLAGAGCDLIYAPAVEEMYPPGFATGVAVDGLAAPLEGEMRPHYFGGVATVVTKLLIQVAPDAAFFGEKDYQQLLVIKRLARDLDLPCAIIGCPTMREPDGLAMSSRNAYLTPNQRRAAPQLNFVLREAVSALKAGAAIAEVERDARARIAAAGFTKTDYVAVRDAKTLEGLEGTLITGAADKSDRPARILAAAWLGQTRLIDNMPV